MDHQVQNSPLDPTPFNGIKPEELMAVNALSKKRLQFEWTPVREQFQTRHSVLHARAASARRAVLIFGRRPPVGGRFGADCKMQQQQNLTMQCIHDMAKCMNTSSHVTRVGLLRPASGLQAPHGAQDDEGKRHVTPCDRDAARGTLT